jgi:hypothetical protein
MGAAMMLNLEEFGVGRYVYERSGRCHGMEEEEEVPEGLRARFGHRGDPLYDELSSGFGPSDGEELGVWHEEMVFWNELRVLLILGLSWRTHMMILILMRKIWCMKRPWTTLMVDSIGLIE